MTEENEIRELKEPVKFCDKCEMYIAWQFWRHTHLTEAEKKDAISFLEYRLNGNIYLNPLYMKEMGFRK